MLSGTVQHWDVRLTGEKGIERIDRWTISNGSAGVWLEQGRTKQQLNHSLYTPGNRDTSSPAEEDANEQWASNYIV